MGGGGGLGQPGDQPSEPPVSGPLGSCSTSVAGQVLGLGQGLAGDHSDLGGEPVDLHLGLPGAPPQRPSALLEAPPGQVGAIPIGRAAGRAALLDPPGQPAEGAHRMLQQVGVGGMVDVGRDDGGVDPERAAAQQLLAGELAKQRGVALGDHLRAGAADQLDQGRGMWHRRIQPDAAAPSPADRVGDLGAQRLVAELVAVLQVQQPQQRLDRHRRAAQPSGEQLPRFSPNRRPFYSG